MEKVRRAGRTQKIAFDASPIDGSRPDLDARIGWLVALSRLHSSREVAADGRAFTEAMADHGVSASRSLVSRWESGEIPIGFDGLQAYEEILGLPAGQLTSLAVYLRSADPGVRRRLVAPHLDTDAPAFGDRLDELLDLVEAGTVTAAQWQELGWHLDAVPVHLRADTWALVASSLVNTLPRADGISYRRLSTAILDLARVPRAQPHFLEALRCHLDDPDVQVVNLPDGLLDVFDPRAVAALPQLGGPQRNAPGEAVASERAKAVAWSLAGAVTEDLAAAVTYSEDKMLPRLIREALFHGSPRIRRHAAWLLAASPFRGVLLDHLLGLLRRESLAPAFRASAARLARHLPTDADQAAVLATIFDPQDAVAVAAARGLGSLALTPQTIAALRAALPEQESERGRAIMFALGRTAPDDLKELSRSPVAWQSRAATWWLAH